MGDSGELFGETATDAELRPAPGAGEATPESRRRAASGLIQTHDGVFRRTARRYSICADDAEDAYQRSLEILLTKAPPIEGDSLVRWMQTVTKREALAVRRQRERLLSSARPSGDDEDRDPLDAIASDSPEPTDSAARHERVVRSGEALRALKPQEVRALTLKAEGYSYAEIGEITGWTYTKINRCMAEGRKRFLQVFADIEEGRRCDELAPVLSAMADGEGGSGSSSELRLHLKSCPACRARLREYRAIPQRVLELAPTAPAVDQSLGGRAHEWVGERAATLAHKIRETAVTLTYGPSGSQSDAAASVAGGLQATAAKVIAVCGVAVAGTGGAYCAVNGVAPSDLVRDEAQQTERPAEPVGSNPLTPPAPPTDAANEGPLKDPSGESAPPAPEMTQAQQTNKEVGFEGAAASTTGGAAGSSGTEFGGPSGGGGGGGSGGGSGGGFSFER
jgi:RNA polymerase sigma factor (sigma-70 family)